MKQPRTSDFDPNAKKHDLKSPMADFPAIEKRAQAATTEDSHTTVPPVLPVRPVRDVPPTAASKRKMKQRHPFDIYNDQYEELKQLALEDRMSGGTGSMSAMVREAIDEYIAKYRAEQGV
jgi:hypothetical protein